MLKTHPKCLKFLAACLNNTGYLYVLVLPSFYVSLKFLVTTLTSLSIFIFPGTVTKLTKMSVHFAVRLCSLSAWSCLAHIPES